MNMMKIVFPKYPYFCCSFQREVWYWSSPQNAGSAFCSIHKITFMASTTKKVSMLGFSWFYFQLCIVTCCRWNRNSLKCSDYCWVDIYFTPLTTSNLKETSIKLKNSSDATKVQNIILSCSWNVNCFYFYLMQLLKYYIIIKPSLIGYIFNCHSFPKTKICQ